MGLSRGGKKRALMIELRKYNKVKKQSVTLVVLRLIEHQTGAALHRNNEFFRAVSVRATFKTQTAETF